jgi:hypothetical protein
MPAKHCPAYVVEGGRDRLPSVGEVAGDQPQFGMVLGRGENLRETVAGEYEPAVVFGGLLGLALVFGVPENADK